MIHGLKAVAIPPIEYKKLFGHYTKIKLSKINQPQKGYPTTAPI